MLTYEIAQKAAEYLEGQGYESSARKDYSGRGMYGATVVAIVSDASGPLVGWAITTIAIDEGGYGDHEIYEMIPQRWDNMGTSMVYY